MKLKRKIPIRLNLFEKANLLQLLDGHKCLSKQKAPAENKTARPGPDIRCNYIQLIGNAFTSPDHSRNRVRQCHIALKQ